VEAVVLCGIQGSGKTTLYVARFLETHVRISRDLLGAYKRLEAPTREEGFAAVHRVTPQPELNAS
jgi:shikimate kinase